MDKRVHTTGTSLRLNIFGSECEEFISGRLAEEDDDDDFGSRLAAFGGITLRFASELLGSMLVGLFPVSKKSTKSA